MLEYTITIHPEFGLDLAVTYARDALEWEHWYKFAHLTSGPRQMDENYYLVEFDVYSDVRSQDAKVQPVRVHFILSEKVHCGDGLHWRKGGFRRK